MAKCKSIAHVRRGDPEFERDYLLRMGLLKPANKASAEIDQLHDLMQCCEFVLPVAEAGAAPGNSPELVATWLKAVIATARRAIADGGMGAMAPMATQKVLGQLVGTRK